MKFEVVSEITNVETIAVGSSIRVLSILNRKYGKGRWRKKKGVATVKLKDGIFHIAEIHWARSTRHRQKGFENKIPFFRLKL